MKKTTKKKSLARGGTKGNPQSSRTAGKRRVVSALPKSKATNAYELLNEVRALILAEPKRYDQHDTLSMRGAFEGIAGTRPSLWPRCGTVGCVAGWTVVLTQPADQLTPFVCGAAADVLGLDDEQSSELFSVSAVEGRPQTVAYAKAGAAHIRGFQQKYADQLKAKSVTR